MSLSIDIHKCVKVDVETSQVGNTRWTTYTFTDTDGRVVEVTAFHLEPREQLNAKLLKFTKEHA